MKKATLLDLRRMCNSYDSEEGKACTECLLSPYNNDSMSNCMDFILTNPYSANNIVVQWCEEHPPQTRQDAILKMFPNAPFLNGSKTLQICPKLLDSSLNDCTESDCDTCLEEYWHTEVDNGY